MLGMLGGGENMSENLSGCLFFIYTVISLHKKMGGGGAGGGEDRTYLSQRREAFVSVPANALAHRLLN